MSSWTCITFDPGERTPEDVASDLRHSLTETDAQVCREDEQREPKLGVGESKVVWRVHGFDGEAFESLEVQCSKALAIYIQDTAEAGTGQLYEWIDGEFLQTDIFQDYSYGRVVLDYFLLEHGMQGERGL